MSQSLTDWASDIVYSLASQGGIHGPGSTRFSKRNDSTYSMLLPGDLEQESEELTREHWRYENTRKVGRYAVTYDGEWKGGPAIWIKAAEFFEDRSREFVIVVQPIKKRWLGRTAPIGAPQQVGSS